MKPVKITNKVKITDDSGTILSIYTKGKLIFVETDETPDKLNMLVRHTVTNRIKIQDYYDLETFSISESKRLDASRIAGFDIPENAYSKYWKAVEPYIISESDPILEEVHKGDYMYKMDDKFVAQLGLEQSGHYFSRVARKVLCFPDNFSQEQIQMITSGEIKEDDTIILKCIMEIDVTIPTDRKEFYRTHLDKNGHIQIISEDYRDYPQYTSSPIRVHNQNISIKVDDAKFCRQIKKSYNERKSK